MSYDLIVIGAGPGGATAAAFAADAGLRVLLLDKDTFPRDKICGDAVSGKSVDVLRRLGVLGRVQQVEQVGSWGVTFSGPYGDEVAIPFTKELDKPVPPGFVCAREVFDDVLFRRAADAGAEIWTNAQAKGLIFESSGDGAPAVAHQRTVIGARVKHAGTTKDVYAPLVVGADGAYSIVARNLGLAEFDDRHYCSGVRAYYEGVTGFNAGNHVELHFVDEAIPGYFWIFPMADGRANVGVGMLRQQVKRRKVKLQRLLEEMIAHPRFRDRFTDAKRIGKLKSWGLPMGSKPRTMAGAGWLLVGDAASLIDPFTGEGIGNAMICGERAAQWAGQAKAANDYSARFLEGYETAVLRYLQTELRISHGMQRLINVKWLLNWVIAKASRSPDLADLISTMFDDETQRKRLLRPGFYWRVLTAR